MNRLTQTYSHTSITTINEGYLLGDSSSGKEKDSETGLSYFGARYYEPGMLNVWLSVDPMADKYPNLSPYNYCAWTRPTGGDEHRWIKYNIVNNPIKLVDPDGRDWYEKTDENGTKTVEWYKNKASCPSEGRYLGLTYHDRDNSFYYSLYAQSGIKYDPQDRYQVDGLNKIIQADRAVICAVKGIRGSRSFWKKHDDMINMCSSMGVAMAKQTKCKPLNKILTPLNIFTGVNTLLDYKNTIQNDSWNTSATISLASDIVSFVPLYGNIVSLYLNGVNYAAWKGAEMGSWFRSYFSPISPNNYFKSQYGY